MKQDMINISIGKHGDREREIVIIMITFRTSDSQPLHSVGTGWNFVTVEQADRVKSTVAAS
jgi:hypothetical protein